MKKILTIILILLGIHLLYTNSELLLQFVDKKTVINTVLRVLFAGSYSAITILIIAIYPKRYVYLVSAILDGVSIYLNYKPVITETEIAVYFGIYTLFIVGIAGEISRKTTENETKTTAKNEKRNRNEIKTTVKNEKRNGNEIKTTDKNEKRNGNEIKTKSFDDNYSFLISRKISIKNSLNRLQNEEKRQKRLVELAEVEKQLETYR